VAGGCGVANIVASIPIRVDSWIGLVGEVGIMWAVVCAAGSQARVVVASYSAVASNTWNSASITV